jgi:hypothetical protein
MRGKYAARNSGSSYPGKASPPPPCGPLKHLAGVGGSGRRTVAEARGPYSCCD